VANYPWDANETGEDGYAKCPDDTTFRFLASTYARKHRKMTEDVEFGAKGGITNGAEWYQISGSMQAGPLMQPRSSGHRPRPV
jgi:carboxypeptidase D